jgi:LuxR family maltose regulon positive regulatory protein
LRAFERERDAQAMAATILAPLPEARSRSAYGVIRRPRLVSPLCDPAAAPLTVVVAPAGYGKTTLLREWAERDPRPFAWLTLDARDSDAGRLLASVTRAIDALEGSDAYVLVLDDVHTVDGAPARRVLASMADELPPGASIAFAARRDPPIGVARLRAQRMIAEIGPRELALTRSEATALTRTLGLELDRDALDLLLRRTEGWPAGISLAGLCLRDRPTLASVERFDGRDRIVADYVRDEVLAELSPQQLRFLRRTSILDTLTGPLCDAVLEQSRSAAALAELADGGALLVPLDRSGDHYRHHRLLAETLHAELRRAEPELERELHRRACAWQRRNGDVDRALHHALAAGDARVAGELVSGSAWDCFTHGRTAVLRHRLDRFSAEQVAHDAGLCLAAAGCHLVRGEGHLAEHWATRAAVAPERDGATAGALAALRAAQAPDGMARMRDDAASAAALLPDAGPWQAVCALLAGVAHQLSGDRDAALARLEEGAHRAAVTAPNVHALCLTQLAVLALDADDWEVAAELSTRARAQVDRHGLSDDATMAIVFAVSAVVRGHRGRIDDARNDTAHALRLQSLLTDFAVWYEIELHVLLARSALRLSDVGRARELLDHAARLERRVAGAPVLEAWLREAWAQLDAFAAGGAEAGPAPCLTAAELRILHYLPTHLSFREVAERTFVSANTVKTQANAVYRKLDVSCRSEAVARATELGLLDA